MKVLTRKDGFFIECLNEGDILCLYFSLPSDMRVFGDIERSRDKKIDLEESKKGDRERIRVGIDSLSTEIREDPFRLRIFGRIFHPEDLAGKHQALEVVEGKEILVASELNKKMRVFLEKRRFSSSRIPIASVDYLGIIGGFLTSDGFFKEFEFESPCFKRENSKDTVEVLKKIIDERFANEEAMYLIGPKGAKEEIAKGNPRYHLFDSFHSYEFAIERFLRETKDARLKEMRTTYLNSLWDSMERGKVTYSFGEKASEILLLRIPLKCIIITDRAVLSKCEIRDEIRYQLEIGLGTFEIVPQKSEFGKRLSHLGGIAILQK